MAGVGRYLGVALTLAYGVYAGAALVRELVPRGDWQAMLLVACWMVLLVALAALALLRPDRAGPVLGWTSAAVAEVVLLVGSVGLVPGDLASQVSAVLVFVTAVPLGLLGLRRPLFAGVFLLALGAAFWLAALVGSYIAGTASVHDLALTGWIRAVDVPVLALGALFLVVATFGQPPHLAALPGLVPPPRPDRPAGRRPGPRSGRSPGRRSGRSPGPRPGRGTGRGQAVSEMASAADRPASRRATGTRNGEQDT
ncbi:MAG TPA: hypothetical protein VFJ09_14095 [Nocardioidaceae bacterium]|nr:hypothetical protein [Nocardioidaceae bacterium]